MTNDAEHLKLLSIFHYIVGGIAALMGLFPVFHLALGIAMVTGRLTDAGSGPDPLLFGWFFVAIAAVMIVAAETFAACMIVAGRFLARRTHYLFCLVMAAIACAFVPFGTVLGVFTILVLQRPTVKELFVRGRPQ